MIQKIPSMWKAPSLLKKILMKTMSRIGIDLHLWRGLRNGVAALNILEKEDIYNQGELYYAYNVDQPIACNNSPIGSSFMPQINYSCYSDFCFGCS